MSIGEKKCWFKMIYLIRSFPEHTLVQSRDFIEQWLVTLLCKWIYWCICTVTQARRWALEERPPSSPQPHLSQQYNLCNIREGPEILASQFSVHLMFTKRADLTPRVYQLLRTTNSLQMSETRIGKGDLLKEGAERPCSFRNPNRRFSWDFWG